MNKSAPIRHANLPVGDTKKITIQENGEPRKPSEPRYWHSRGYLPHFENPEAIQHVTFHLADSLPKSVLERLVTELKSLPSEKQEVEKRKRVDAWIDAGHGSCILRETEIAAMVQDALLFFDGQRYRLLEWVIMPNHVHVLFQPLNGWTVAKIVASWKKFSARKICDYRRANPGHANLPIGEVESGEAANQKIGVPSMVWHREYWDRYIRDEQHLQRAIEYIHQNPVKAGLVATADAWPWSSAAWNAAPGNADLPERRSPDRRCKKRQSGDWLPQGKPMNEAETRAEHIDPALQAAGWGVIPGSRIRREFPITPGRIQGGGRRGKSLTADYVLVYRNRSLAVIEAKAWGKPFTEGVGQAKDYATKLALRFAYATNGHGLYAIDMHTGKEGPIQGYPTPDELWNQTFAQPDTWRDHFAAIPFEDRGGSHPSRYYQDIAVERVLEAIAANRSRILLTLATGTGKTFIAFQIAWKLFYSRWNLTRQPARRPRILFLADRNILANQAYNEFSAFPEDALVRIEPGDIRKKGRIPKNGSLFFTIFQTFMSGNPGHANLPIGDLSASRETGDPRGYFGQYSPDFFDLIIIDECHRGGANDESNWRAILEYFSPAVQLGLTATPKRTENVDTYAYFGEPVYTYSLKEGINDGFLTPFKVKEITTSLDEYIYTPDDTLIEGQIERGRTYTETDFNRIIEIMERETHRVQLFMSLINQAEKTLVFCATQDHALAVRDLINQIKTSSNPHYCERVTANDGTLGEQHLRDFQDNEKTIPTILTTSQKLSTGVDARNIRNIVLMRPINSMIEFKQIIGRGTRLYEGKEYFTIYDFVQAHHHFSDPEWDGEPAEPPEPAETRAPARRGTPDDVIRDERGEYGSRPIVKVQLADGKARSVQNIIVTTFWHPDGTPMTAQQFMELLFGKLPEFFTSEAELCQLWSAPATRADLLHRLTEKGFGPEQLAEMQRIIDAQNSDLFDVLAYVAYALPTLTRIERAATAQTAIRTRFNPKQQAFIDFVLAQYIQVGVEELAPEKLSPLLRLKYHNALADAIADLGQPAEINQVFAGFQKYLYQQPGAA